MRATDGEPILVTGCTGFIGKHIVLRLIRDGVRVRGTLREPAREGEVRHILRSCHLDDGLFEARQCDLTSDDGWDAAVNGCRFVIHSASPFPSSLPRDKLALVPEAKGGTLRVLQASQRAGVERVVLTSSVAAIFYGHDRTTDRIFSERDFSNVESPQISAYAVSKTEAEKAAWEYLRDTGTDLAVINPSLVSGPALDTRLGTSANILRLMMSGRMPLVPDLGFGIVDVRDVAEAHVRAIRSPRASGRRFIVSADSLKLTEIASVLSEAFPTVRRRLPKAKLHSSVVHAAAYFSGRARTLAEELGPAKRLDVGPAEEILGLKLRSAEEAIIALGESLISLGLIEL